MEFDGVLWAELPDKDNIWPSPERSLMRGLLVVIIIDELLWLLLLLWVVEMVKGDEVNSRGVGIGVLVPSLPFAFAGVSR